MSIIKRKMADVKSLGMDEKIMGLDFISGEKFYNRWRDTVSWQFVDYENKIMHIHPTEAGNIEANGREKFYTEKPSILYPGGIMKPSKPVIEYKYNSNGFRSDEFNNIDNDTKAVFLGCSITEGVGGNLEDIWAKKVYNHLLKDNKISNGFYNLGMAGAGIQTLVIHFMKYVSTYGPPKYLFALMPYSGRQYVWQNNSLMWTWNTNQVKMPQSWRFADEDPSSGVEETLLEWQKQYSFFLASAAASIFLLEEYCNQIGTSLLWHTWVPKETDHFKGFDKFIPVPIAVDIDSLSKDTAKIINSIKEESHRSVFLHLAAIQENLEIKSEDISFRDGHPGIIYHEYWADLFIKEIKNRGI